LFGEVVAAESMTQIATELADAQAALQQAINELDPDTLSPREALDALYQLKNLLP
jgi:DNA mismatch repair protein MutS